MGENTTIAIKKETRDKLKECRSYYRESYDSILLKMINEHKKRNK